MTPQIPPVVDSGPDPSRTRSDQSKAPRGHCIQRTARVFTEVRATVVWPLFFPVTLTVIVLPLRDFVRVGDGFVAPLIAFPAAYHWYVKRVLLVTAALVVWGVPPVATFEPRAAAVSSEWAA